MDSPKEFQNLVQRMHQDVDMLVSSDDELVAYLVRGLSADGREVVRRFLTDFLARNPTSTEALALLDTANSDWFLRKDRIIPFLSAIRDEFDRRRSLTRCSTL